MVEGGEVRIWNLNMKIGYENKVEGSKKYVLNPLPPFFSDTAHSSTFP